MRIRILGAVALATALTACGPTVAGPSAQHRHEHHLGLAAAAAPAGPVAAPRTRTYYIAADEVLWDYAPDGRNDITGQPFGDEENVFVQRGPTRIGHIYRKSLYRAYTDATFTTPVPRPTSCPVGVKPCDDTLGMLGPVIRAIVGDTIKVVFRNNTSFPASMHPHGVFYDKSSEGAPYADGTSGAAK